MKRSRRAPADPPEARGNSRVVDVRIDYYPTHRCGRFKLRPGRPFPFGATLVPGGVNFSIYSAHATACNLLLFEKGAREPMAEIPFPDSFRMGHVWSMVVFDLDAEAIEYGYRMDGPQDPAGGHCFDPSVILLDPYAKAIGGRDRWGTAPDPDEVFPYRGRLVFEDFDWEDDRPLEIPIEDLVIYEMHVRGFTRHPSAGCRYPGTYAAILEKIPYLKALGVNAVELMPVFEFDEAVQEVQGLGTFCNYWGYATVGFFAPKAGYAATGPLGMQVDEFKNLVKELHRAGIEVLLDVVFNHTAEGNERGPTISFRGIDNKTYYMLAPGGHYYNFSGCGNTLNCNHATVRAFVLDCLRYWAAEYHIDGFRFDLASILGRDPKGRPLHNPPLLESLAADPLLGRCKLIAEAWDAGGLYQVGSFPAYGRWAEWNGKYRDDLRRYIKGDAGVTLDAARRVLGSPDLYAWNGRGPRASINFITCHDGFTLHDLCSYDRKHNEANGEGNRDGSNDNHSWNCGVEGPRAHSEVLALRRRLAKNAWTILMVSQGVPMVLMGDEFGRTQGGNNNTYCHDTEINWLDWGLAETNADLLRFARCAIAFRHAHPVLRPREHSRGEDHVGSGLPDVSCHGTRAWQPDWSGESRVLAFLLCGRHARGGAVQDDTIYVAMNSHWEGQAFELPGLSGGMRWRVAINTGVASPEDIHEVGREPELAEQGGVYLGPRSVLVLVGR